MSTVKKAAKKTVKKAAAKKSAVKKVVAKKAASKSAAVKKSVKKVAAKESAVKVVKKSQVVKKAPVKEDNPVIALGRECVSFLNEKKGSNVVFLDLRDVSSYLDYFIICTASSKIHCRSLAKDIEEFYLSHGQKPAHRPDYDSEWVILDYYGLIIHVFTEEIRSYYDLDRLWADAERL